MLEDPEAERGRVVGPRSGLELDQPRHEDLDAVAHLTKQKAGLLELGVELLAGGPVLAQALAGGGEAEREFLAGLEQSALDLALVRVSLGTAHNGAQREIVVVLGGTSGRK